MSDVFFERRDHRFLFRLVSANELGFFDQTRVDVEVRRLLVLFYTSKTSSKYARYAWIRRYES
jgi:hypothetical protein